MKGARRARLACNAKLGKFGDLRVGGHVRVGTDGSRSGVDGDAEREADEDVETGGREHDDW